MVQMNPFSGQKLKHKCREQTYGHQGGNPWGCGGGVMNWAIGIDMYTLMCIKLMTNKNLLYKKINKIKNNNNSKTNRGLKVTFNSTMWRELVKRVCVYSINCKGNILVYILEYFFLYIFKDLKRVRE